MSIQFHILNGDCLLHQFPNNILGEKIVIREALVDGSLEGADLTSFFKTRSEFFVHYYKLPNEEEYYNLSVAEFTKIKNIPSEVPINLWFEDDLFCQTNFWFIAHLLQEFNLKNPCFLVRPSKGNEYSFGAMNETELITSFKSKVPISPNNLIALQQLWLAYQQKNTSQMLNIAQSLHSDYTFIGPAVCAHISKQLRNPEKVLKQIATELNTSEFDLVFKEFSKREAIYGFGDAQVKRMFDTIMQQQNEQ